MDKISATGRRKASIARVFAQKGSGNITINDKDYKAYIQVLHLQHHVTDPLRVAGITDYDFIAKVYGGGVKGQAEAIKLGIARAIVKINPELKTLLKKESMMTRDSRIVERKKPGLKKARKRDQFSKR